MNKKLNLIARILKLPRIIKILIILTSDVCSSILASYFALCLRLDNIIPLANAAHKLLLPIIFSILTLVPIFFFAGGFRMIIRFGINSGPKTITNMIILYSIPYMIIFTGVGINNVPRSLGILQPFLLWLLIILNRLTMSSIINLKNNRYASNNLIIENSKITQYHANKILIYGAGELGRQLCKNLGKNICIAGFVDDNPELWGGLIENITVYSPNNLSIVIAKENISDILVTIQNLTAAKKKIIIDLIKQHSVRVKILPRLYQIANGRIKFSTLKEIEITEILGRDIVEPYQDLMAATIKNKHIMITGAGGSIGAELAKQIISLAPKKLILFELHEFSLYKIEQIITKIVTNHNYQTEIIPILGDLKDFKKLQYLFKNNTIDTIFHAAAYKHVSMIERNAFSGVYNNVFGTLHLAELSLKHNVKNFVLISTDKAVRPTSIMGASKRICELILQALQHENNSQNIIFSMVRFGNVLGSSGSVIPLFNEQIKNGGPVTITHPDIIRYFMTIEEAAQLVIQSATLAKGGEVMLLDMGDPIKIKDLAVSMIHLSGLTIKDKQNLDGDIEIIYTGLRAGEKLYEELLIDEQAETTAHPKILKAQEYFIKLPQLRLLLKDLDKAIQLRSTDQLINTINSMVPEFNQKAIKNTINSKLEISESLY